MTLAASAPLFTPTILSGTSTGRLEPLQEVLIGFPPPTAATYVIRIDASGDVGVARGSLSVDGGATYESLGVLFRDTFVPKYAIEIIAFNGAASPNSFLAGDTLTFTSPGSAEYVQGADDETAEHLAARCRARWSALSRNPTDGLLMFWALRAVPQATRLALSVDPRVPGRAHLIAADSHGPLDQAALNAIVSYILRRLSPLDSFDASAADKLLVTAGGSVIVDAREIVTVQEAAQKAWTAYLGQVPIGGIVRIFDLEGILMEAGAIDCNVGFDELRLNDDPSNLILPPKSIPVEASSLTKSLAWVTA